MRIILCIVAVLLLSAPVFSQPGRGRGQHPGPPQKHSSPKHIPQQHHRVTPKNYTPHPRYVPTGPRFNCGYVHNGVRYRHYCFDHYWNGWSACRWHGVYGYIYFCPVQGVWYRYIEIDMIFIPVY